MTSLVSLVALCTTTGARCHLAVIQGLLRNGMTLEVSCEGDDWTQLIRVRKVITSATEIRTYLCTTDNSAYLVQPSDLILVRVIKKAGETP